MKKGTFTIPAKVIWLSSLSLGIIVSVPKIVERPFNVYETIANFVITFLFAVIIWYYNVLTIPVFSSKRYVKDFSIIRLIRSLAFGLAVMFLLACLQQFLLSHMNFGPVMLMFEVRGILVNLTFYMFIHLLYQSYHNQRVDIELEQTRMDNLGAQYELLKQQVNPHFLFNSLNTLKYMVESQDAHSVDFILKLSDFYRFTLEKRKLDVIRLSEELDILRSYVYLLKARFEEGIGLDIRIGEQYYPSLIPPFTLQLLVENCIKHNIVSLQRPLKIAIYSADGFIVVENKVQPKKTPESSTGMGLENIDQRYTHLWGEHIEIVPGDELFTVKLPVVYEDRDHRG